MPRNHKQQVTQPFLHNTVKEIRRKAFERKWLSERRDEDRGGGGMEVNGEATRRLLQIDLERDRRRRRPEAGRGKEGEMEGGELEEERRNVSPPAEAAAASSLSLPLSLDLTPSIPAATEG